MSSVICEGYLTKSPPEHKINRARWCRRYFQLCSTEGNVQLHYYKDESCAKLKGTINLRECEQVDQGLSFETKNKLRDAHIFDVVTQRRKYFLVTESETDMLRWVQSICSACGFQSEDTREGQNASASPAGQEAAAIPLNSYSPEPLANTLPVTATTTTTTSQPTTITTTNGDESYIPLDECNTGNDGIAGANLPPKVNGRDPQPHSSPPGKANKWDTMSSTSSSAPSDSAPSPPPSRPTSQITEERDIYDIPPVRQADDAPPVPKRPLETLSNDEGAYKLLPGTKDPMSTKFERQISKQGNRGSFSNSDDMATAMYDLVPPPGERTSLMLTEECDGPQTNYDIVPPPRPPPPPATTEDLYQVPPRRSIDSTSEGVYDIPPCSPPNETYDIVPRQPERTPLQSVPSRLKASDSISKSTDDLARSFEEISQHNAHQSVTNGDLEHSTYDPIPALDLNASIGSNNSFSVFSDHGPSSTGMDVPPRPAKPASRYPSTPPPSVEDSYMPQPAHSMPPQDLVRKLSNIDVAGVPHRNGQPPSMGSSGHTWLEQPILPPPSYANTKRTVTSGSSVRPNSYNPQGYWPMTNRANTIGGRVQSGMVLHNGQSGMVNGHHPQGYMAMQGSSDSPRLGGLQGTITEDSYMPMQSQNEPNTEAYTNLPSSPPPAIPQRPPRPSTSSTASADSIPPPIDRSSKPRSTDSTILTADMMGMEGSFYATNVELPPNFPTPSPGRTKSFTKRQSRHSTNQYTSDGPRTPPRPLRSLHSSGSSHEPYSVPAAPSPIQDDSYVFPDQPSPAKPSMTSLSHGSPMLPPQSHQVEYLELDHESDSQASASKAPAKAPPVKDQVEYIHLDLEKTKALQEVTQNREESYRPKNNDSGTLKK